MGSTANGETHPFLQLPHPGPVPNRAPPVWRGRQGHPPAFPGTEWRTCPVPPLPAPLVPSQDPPTCWQVQALPGHAEVPAGEVCRDLVGPGSLPSPGPPSHIRHQPDTVTRQASPHPALPSAHQQAQTHFPPRFYNQTPDGSISAAPTYFTSYIYQTRHFFSPQKLPHLSFPRLHPPWTPPAMQHSAIHWFRKGLRLHDNPALLAAAAGCHRLHPLFILDPSSSRAGTNAWRFLLDALRDLDGSLREMGSR